MATEPLINRLVILGVGLMGASLALAAKRAGVVGEVAGWSRRESTLEKALAAGVVDVATRDLDEVLKGADMVVVATPTQLAEQVIVDVVKRVGDDVVVTDVASVKGNLQAALKKAFGSVPQNVVLGHPIAGSEKSGVDAANIDLYRHHHVILIDDHAATAALSRVTVLWEAVGASVFTMSADKHDDILARTSHLPHLLAYALVAQLSSGEDADSNFKFAAGGFRDFTRIASSDPTMWQEIFAVNQSALLSALDEFDAASASLRVLIEAGDSDAIENELNRIKQVRDDFAAALQARKNGES